MKKGLVIILVFAAIFAFAACTKQPGQTQTEGETYVAPPTEIITFENGETAVYEVVTDTSGVAVTDANGETEFVPYDPPVTEKNGYLVTDAVGSTIKQSATTVAPSAEVENAFVDLDEPTAAGTQTSTTVSSGTTVSNGESITNPSQAVTDSGEIDNLPDATTAAQTTAAATTSKPASTTQKSDSTSQTVNIAEAVTYAFNGDLSKEDAQKLMSIVSIDNRFDEALCDGDYEKAAEELPQYIADIEEAIGKIKADKDLYKFVGDENLNAWLEYIKQAETDYAVFMGIYTGIADQTGTPPIAFYTTYETFQNSYRQSLKTFYHIKLGAQEIIYS